MTIEQYMDKLNIEKYYKKIIAELRNVPLEKDGEKTWYRFCHLWPKDLNILKKCIKETSGIWYDKDYFGGRL